MIGHEGFAAQSEERLKALGANQHVLGIIRKP
jgi:hypothetical protein